MTTCAPTLASAIAAARPMPREAPVTSAVFPLHGVMIDLPCWRMRDEPIASPEPGRPALRLQAASRVQEQGSVGHEQLRILVVRPMAGIRVDDELRVRQ